MVDLSYLTQAYLKYYRRRLSAAWEINYSHCFRYAAIVHTLHGGQLISVTTMLEDLWAKMPGQYVPNGSHAFVKIDNKYYDSESVGGVSSWEDLNYFKRFAESNPPYRWYYEVREHPSVRSFRRFWKPTKTMSKSDRRFLRMLEARNRS